MQCIGIAVNLVYIRYIIFNCYKGYRTTTGRPMHSCTCVRDRNSLLEKLGVRRSSTETRAIIRSNTRLLLLYVSGACGKFEHRAQQHFVSFSSTLFIVFSLSLLLVVVTQIWGHILIVGSMSCPPPHRGSCLHFYRKKT